MINSYLKMTWRNLTRNRVSSFINICGLSVGLATGIIILLVIWDELRYDKFHANLKDIYLLMKNEEMGGRIITGEVTPGPLAASVRSEIPEVKHAARLAMVGAQLLRAGDKSLYEQSVYAEPDLFSMMTFPALQGNAVAALRDPSSVVITERTARKLFGQANVTGRLLVLNNAHTLKVGAVLRDMPQNSTYRFDVVLPFRLLEQGADWLQKWDHNSLLTWIQVKPGTNPGHLNAKLKKMFMAKQSEQHVALFAYPFARLHLHGKFSNGRPKGGGIEIVALLGIIGAFVLLIACVNFMNLSTAQSDRRAREVGVRKVLGASRKRIAIQFMGEALFLSFLALVLGVILARLALSGFMQLTGKTYALGPQQWPIGLLVLCMCLLTGLLAGSYPALYLSGFQPVKVLKRVIHTGRQGSLLRKGLVTFQFVIAIFLIIGTIVIYKQIDHAQHRPVGYNRENLIVIPARGDMGNRFELLRNELLQLPGIKQVSAAEDNLTNLYAAVNELDWPGKTAGEDFYFNLTHVYYDWARTTGVRIAEGRDFSQEYGADSLNCLINQAAVKRMGLKPPVVGTRVGGHTVIGVVEDFVFNSPVADPNPVLILLNRKGLNNFFVRITNDGNWRSTVAGIEKIMKKINPDYPFEFHFVKDEYEKKFNEVRAVSRTASVFAVMAIFISCLGLFGLSAFMAERRNREVSIRKVLGASIGSLWFALSKDFLKPVLLAFLLAAPPAAYVMQQLLQRMDYRIHLQWWMFALAGMLALLIAVVTVSFHGVKAAMTNPAKALGAE